MLKQNLKMSAKVRVAFPVQILGNGRKKSEEQARMKAHYKIYRITPEIISRIIERIKDL